MQTSRSSCRQAAIFLILSSQGFATVAWNAVPTLSPSQIIDAPADMGPIPTPAYFGRELSRDADTTLISGTSNLGSGVCYVYKKNRFGDWEHGDTLIIPDADFTLQDIVVEGNMALITATNKVAAGRVYVYRRVREGWRFVQRIDPPLNAPGGYAQGALSFDGKTAVVTAPFGDGAAYVYTRNSAGTLDLTATLVETSPGPLFLQFGAAAVVDGSDLVVGASGANDFHGGVYVYKRVQGTWQLLQVLAASDGAAGDAFGAPIALSGKTMLIGATSDDRSQADQIHQGSAYVFAKHDGQWHEEQKIENPTNGAFSDPIALDGRRLVIVARYIREHANDPNGIARAYVYERRRGSWSSTAVLEGPQPSNDFALDLELDGKTILTSDITVPTPDPVFDGQAYEFRLRLDDPPQP
jgi:hypothetical protein